jgi:hypothetical protein
MADFPRLVNIAGVHAIKPHFARQGNQNLAARLVGEAARFAMRGTKRAASFSNIGR